MKLNTEILLAIYSEISYLQGNKESLRKIIARFQRAVFSDRRVEDSLNLS